MCMVRTNAMDKHRKSAGASGQILVRLPVVLLRHDLSDVGGTTQRI